MRHVIAVDRTGIVSRKSSARYASRDAGDWLYETMRMIMLLRRVALELLGFGQQAMRFVL